MGSTDQPVLRFVESNIGGNVEIVGYDINDAILTSFGGSSNNYSGLVTPGLSFQHFSNPGTFATFSGVGDGTLNDGFVSNTLAGNHLFLTPEANNVTGGAKMDDNPDDNIPSNPAIFLTLAGPNKIDNIDIFGGNIVGNAIPGLLASVEVQLLDTKGNLHSEVIESFPFGATISALGNRVNDRICLRGTTLEGIDAVAVFLSNFDGPFELASGFGPSISEIELYGNATIGDVNRDESINLLDVDPFVQTVLMGRYDAAADINGDCDVNLLDVAPFIDLLLN